MNPKAERVVALASHYLGAPYKRNAWLLAAPKEFSCSTFTRYIFRKVGVRLPRKAIEQAKCGRPVESGSIEPGDLIFVRGARGFYDVHFPDGIGHVGIYVGHGTVISARCEGVTEESIGPYLERGQYRVIRRIL